MHDENRELEKQLRGISDGRLLESTQTAVQQEKRSTIRVLLHLREVDRRRLYAESACSSLFEYAVKHLGYSEGESQRRIAAMRLLRELPEVEQKLESGTVSLSTLNQMRTFFNHEEKESEKPLSIEKKREILQAIEGKSCNETERTLLGLSSHPEAQLKKKEGTRPVSAELTEVKFLADAELMRDLEKLRGFLAQRNAKNLSLGELIGEGIGLALGVLDPARQMARRSRKPGKPGKPRMPLMPRQSRKPTPASQAQEQAKPERSVAPFVEEVTESKPENFIAPSKEGAAQPKPEPRLATPAQKREVFRKARSQCTFVDPKTGERCKSFYKLEVDHVVPHSLGGETKTSNLRVLCRHHHERETIRAFGLGKFEEAVRKQKQMRG